VSVGDLSGLVASIAGAVSVLLTVVTFIVRRLSQERRDLREMQQVNLVQARYLYKIEYLAASQGWDNHANWPPKPAELTPEYLKGKADAEGNPELIKYLQQITGQGEKK
jgi:hypothetical protein